MPIPHLYLVHEPEAACRAHLAELGFGPQRALEISSYLAQSTDLAPEFPLIEAACEARGLRFTTVELDDAPAVLTSADRESRLVWTLTDGIAYFRGGAAPAIARLAGLPTLGADDSLFALCQDKFRCGAVLSALGIPTPVGGLIRNGEVMVEPAESKRGWFIKPNRLGSKIGIWPDSHCRSLDQARDLSARIHRDYRDDAIVQPYVPGRNVRASYLAVDPAAGVEALGVFLVEAGGDFQTMEDSMALYGDTGAAARAAGLGAEPELVPLAASQPEADSAIRRIATRLMAGLGLRDVFSIDFRVEADDTVHLIEFEVCPGLPCFDFRAYCRRGWGMDLADAMAQTAARRLLAG